MSRHSLDDLLQYIYNGQVNIKEENLETFLKTAEAFGIKGLNNGTNLSNFAQTQPRCKSNRPLNPFQYQSIAINKRKLVTHSGHQNKDNIPTSNYVLPFIVTDRSQHIESNDAENLCAMPESSHDDQSPYIDNQLNNHIIPLDDLKVFDDEKTPLQKTKHQKHVEQNEQNDNQGFKRKEQPDIRMEGNHGHPAIKRAKHTNRNGKKILMGNN